jgi:hypothetical protein
VTLDHLPLETPQPGETGAGEDRARAGSLASGKGRRRSAVWALRVLALRASGRTLDEIAAATKAPRSTVFDLLQRFEGLTLAPEVLEAYEQNRPALLNAAELRLLRALVDEKKIDAASLNNAAYAFRQVFDARRLEHGQSTQNLALHELVERVERERARAVARVPQPPALADGNGDGNAAAK